MISSLLIPEETLSMLANSPMLDALLILVSTLCLIMLNIFILPHVHMTNDDGRIDMLGVITRYLYIICVILYIFETPKTAMRLIKELGPYIR